MTGKDVKPFIATAALALAPLPAPLSLPAPALVSANPSTRRNARRITVDGKFFRDASDKWFLKGFTYGPFTPTDEEIFFPDRQRARSDLEQIRALGANSIRVYHTPPEWLIDDVAAVGLRIFIDVPWEKHRCFLEDYCSQQDARERVRRAAILGRNPAVFAISVANEIPKDVVRFYGERRIERFLHELLDVAKQTAPQCLVTYTNFPSTEFLRPWPLDFYCFNVYLEDPAKLGAYFDRLQHIAGNFPLILGEHGADSIRHGQAAQAQQLSRQVARVFEHGLAGSFVFSFTDDWYAGGAAVEDWAFGVTDRYRCAKPASAAVSSAWNAVPHAREGKFPRVSVVVCSYNGAATLEECLWSLVRLKYPDFEVILVDDGSTDHTREIAARFPFVKYVHQENCGLSAARNVGARLATGEIVAYADSDCIADEDWLRYLVMEMRRQQVELIGGPNIPPPNDSLVARCVALSPGGPSHVMLDDRLAEHVPGCNLACRREKLLALGGFDEQFRQAGDDVDICWRFIDAGMNIGYAASAVVWHHRRSSVREYLRQQAGYGRSEAMLHFKHPTRFNAVGSSLWSGVIYGEGAHGLPFLPPVIYHGRFGLELFPSIYRQNRVSAWAYFTLIEWHMLSAFVLLLSTLYFPLLGISLLMWSATLISLLRAGVCAPLPESSPRYSRLLICLLHLLQPIVRGWHRYQYRLRRRKLPSSVNERPHDCRIPSGSTHFDINWQSTQGRGRELLLERTVQAAETRGWLGDFHCSWEPFDLLLIGDNWHGIELRTATEELGAAKRFTRVRTRLRATGLSIVAAGCTTIWSFLSVWQNVHWAQFIAMMACALLAGRLLLSRRDCRRAAADLLYHSGRRAALNPVDLNIQPAPSAPCDEADPAEARVM